MRKVLVFLFLCLTGAAFAQGTSEEERDRGLLQGFIEDNLSVAGREVRIEGFAGALSSRATLDEMTIADADGVWLRLEGAALDWSRASLLRGAIEISELSAEKLEILRVPQTDAPPSPEASGGFALPDLPVSVNIETLLIQRVELGETLLGQPLALRVEGAANLNSGAGTADLSVDRLDGPEGKIGLTGSYSNSTRDLSLDLSFNEGPGGIAAGLIGLENEPPVELTVKGAGTLDDFTAEILLLTDGIERLGGSVGFGTTPGLGDGADPDSTFMADISGDIAPLLLPQYQDFFGDSMTLDVAGTRRAAGQLELDRLELATRSLNLSGQIRLGPDGWPEIIDIAGQLASPDGEEVLLPLSGPETWVQRADVSIQYDAASGESWGADITVDALRRADMGVARAALTGSGTLVRGEGAALGSVAGALDLDIAGIALADPALAEAAGDAVTGSLSFAYTEDQPLQLSDLALTTGDVTLSGAAVLSGLLDPDTALAIDGGLMLAAADLARFAAVTGTDLSGAAELDLSGRMEPVTGVFDVALEGTGTGLGIGNAFVDPLIAGTATLDIAAVRDETGLTLDRLNIDSPNASIAASGQLTSAVGSATFDLSIPDASVISADLSGPLSLDGTADRSGSDWTIDADLAGPGGLAGDVRATASAPDDLLDSVSGQADLSIDTLAPYSAVAGRDLNGALSVSVAGSGRPDDMTFDVSVDGSSQDLSVGIEQVDLILAGSSDLSINASRDATGVLSFRDTRFESAHASADIAGAVGGGSGEITFDAVLNDIGRLIDSVAGAARLSGTVTQTGEDWGIDASFTGPGEADGTIDASLSVPGGVLGDVSGTVTADIATLEPYAALTGLPIGGGLSVNVTGSGNAADLTGSADVAATTRDLRIGDETADRMLAGTSSLALKVSRDAEGLIAFDQARFSNPQAQAQVSGQVGGGAGRVTFDAALTDLGTLVGETIGAARLRGALSQDGDDWTIDTDFTGPGDTTGTLAGTLALPDGKPGDVDAALEASVGSLAPYSALAGRTLGGGLELSLDASGNVEAMTGTAQVSAKGTDLAVGIAEVNRLLSGASALSLDVSRDADGTLRIGTAQFETGQLTAEADGSLGPDGGAANFDVRLANVGLFAQGFNGPATATGSVTSQGAQWLVDASVTGPGGIAASVSGPVAQDASTANLSISGNAPLEVANAFIAPTLVTGNASFNLSLNGPLALSSLSGNVRTSDAGLTMSALRFRLQQIGAEINIAGGTAQLSLGASVVAGGRVQVAGPISLAAPYNADLAIDLIDVVSAEAGLYETSVAGRVTIAGPLTGGALIAGTLNLGKVEVRIPNASGLASGDLPDLRHVAEPSGVRLTRARAGLLNSGGSGDGGGNGGGYPLDLTINAPSQIFIRGRGLDAEMGGALRLTGTTNNVVTQGGFDLIRGRMDLLGERLDLTEGSVRLQGDFNPYIRLVATTVSGDVTIQIVVEGFVSSPDLEVTSQPDLPEEEALARLLFKRGLDEISAVQALQLAVAVRTLAGGGGEGIVGRLRQNFGLDDLDVTTDEDGNAAVSVGKYISENIYTGVQVDSSGKSEVNLNLQITPSLTARGSAGSDGNTGVGIYFERDY